MKKFLVALLTAVVLLSFGQSVRAQSPFELVRQSISANSAYVDHVRYFQDGKFCIFRVVFKPGYDIFNVTGFDFDVFKAAGYYTMGMTSFDGGTPLNYYDFRVDPKYCPPPTDAGGEGIPVSIPVPVGGDVLFFAALALVILLLGAKRFAY